MEAIWFIFGVLVVGLPFGYHLGGAKAQAELAKKDVDMADKRLLIDKLRHELERLCFKHDESCEPYHHLLFDSEKDNGRDTEDKAIIAGYDGEVLQEEHEDLYGALEGRRELEISDEEINDPYGELEGRR